MNSLPQFMLELDINDWGLHLVHSSIGLPLAKCLYIPSLKCHIVEG